MSLRTAPEAGLGTDDEDLLASWGVDDDGDELEPESPEPAAAASPADPSAQADDDATLPGDAVGEPDAQAQPTSPPADAGRDEAQPDAAATAQEAAQAPAEVTPWSFTADGKQVTVQRSQVFEAVVDPATGAKERFVLIPESELHRTVQPHLADRGTWRQKERGYLEQIAQLAPDNHADVIRARELTQFLWSLFDQPAEQLVAMVQQLRAERPTWDAQQEAAALKAQLAARDSIKQDPDAAVEQLNEQEFTERVEQDLQTMVADALRQPQFAGIAPERALSLLKRARPTLIVTADQDYPEAGIKKGEKAWNLAAINEILTEEAAYAKQLRARATTASTIQQQNAAALGKPAQKPKPAPRAAPKVEEEEVDPWADILNTDDD